MKRILKISGIVIGSVLLIVFLFLSPIIKYVITNNSEEWIGRKVKIESLWINIFTGSIHVENFKLLEKDNEKIFFGFTDFYCKVSVVKLIAGKYNVSPITLKQPEISIVQKGNHFNFDDLLKRFADTAKVKEEKVSDPIKYFISNFTIQSGTINYSNTHPLTDVSIIKLNISASPIAYYDSVFNMLSDFGFKSGGQIKSVLNFNANSMAYALKLNTDSLNIVFLLPYLKDFMKVKSLDGLVSTDLRLSGNFNNATDIGVSGSLRVNDFSIVDTTGEKLTGFSMYTMSIDSVNTKAGIYNFNSVVVDEPYLKFAMYDDGYNFDRILTSYATDSATAPVEEYSNVFQMMAGYIRDIYNQYMLNEYRFDKLDIRGGNIVFTDYTVEDKFLYVLDSMSLSSDNFDSGNNRILLSLACRLNKSGVMQGSLSINPIGFNDMEINYSIKGLLISDINPYSKYYVATPFLNGIINYENNSVILDNKLKSTNKLFIEKIKVGDKVKNSTAYHLPVKLAVIILRDSKGNINLEIPVVGDLKDPKYKIGKVIWQIFKNLIVKAATAPFNLLASAFGGKEEDYKELQFQYLQEGVSEDQSRVLNNLFKVIENKPDLNIEFIQVNNMEDEIEHLAIYYAKKEYLGYEKSDSLTGEDFKKVNEASAKDSLFVIWLDTKSGSKEALTSVQDKCIKLLGKEKLLNEVHEIMERRNSVLLDYFVSKKIAPEKIRILNAKDESQLKRTDIPHYVINFFATEGENLQTPEK